MPISASLNRSSVSGMQRRVDRDHVADLDHRLDGRVERQAEFLLDLGRQPVPVGVVQLDVERLEPAQHRQADATGRDGADCMPSRS